MTADEQVDAVSLFFFFAILDEETALRASEKTIAQLKSKKESSVNDSLLCRVLARNFGQYSPETKNESSWVEASRVDIETWFKFHRESDRNEITVIILSCILGFDDKDIASGLGASLGTIRYRISKGIRRLGDCVNDAGVSS